MPIKAENRDRYPRDWPQIAARIKRRAGNKCEFCGVPNHVYRNRGTGEWTRNEMQAKTWACVDGERVTRIVLTVAHLNHEPEDCRDENLRALCQRCHLRYDAAHHRETAYRSRRQGRVVADLFEDSKMERAMRAEVSGEGDGA